MENEIINKYLKNVENNNNILINKTKIKYWLIIYDIKNDKRLRKIAKVMENYGVRVQKSVFELYAEYDVILVIKKQVQSVMEEEDFIVYFPICVKDWQKRIKYGPVKYISCEAPEYVIV